jgi:hypothetical protein
VKRRETPTLHIRVTLEELPVSAVAAYSAEDEERLRLWLTSPAVRAGIAQAVLDALDGYAERRAA